MIKTNQLINAIDEIEPRVSPLIPKMDTECHTPSEIVDLLKNARLFRMLVPKVNGGLETDLVSTLKVLTRISEIDGSIGWLVMTAAETPLLLSRLASSRFEHYYTNSADIVVAAAIKPSGTATTTQEGYRINGKWKFVSGCEISDAVLVHCKVLNSETGSPPLRAFLISKEKLHIRKNWSTLGLRATASHDIEVPNVFAHEHDSFTLDGSSSSNIRTPELCLPMLTVSTLHIAAIAIGIAQGGLNELISSTLNERENGVRTRYNDPLFRLQIGKSQSALTAIRAGLFDLAAQCLDAELEVDEVRSTCAWITAIAAERMTSIYNSTRNVIFDDSTIMKKFRDMHTLTQHSSVNEKLHIDYAGQLFTETS